MMPSRTRSKKTQAISSTHLHLFSFVALLIFTIPVDAAVVSFTNRVDFNTATAGLGSAITESFDAFTLDTMLSTNQPAPTPFTGFAAYHQGTGGIAAGVLVQAVDVAPFTASGAFAPGTTPYLVVLAARAGNGVDGASSQTFVLPDSGTLAFGSDYQQWGDSGNITDVEVTTSAGIFTVLNPAAMVGFLGFHTTEPGESIQSITWLPRPGGSLGFDAIGVDNVTTVIPEPGTISLLAVFYCMMLDRRRRRLWRQRRAW